MTRRSAIRAGIVVLSLGITVLVAVICVIIATSGMRAQVNQDSRTIKALQQTVSGIQGNVTALQGETGGISLNAAQIEELTALQRFTDAVCTNPDVDNNGQTVSADYPCALHN